MIEQQIIFPHDQPAYWIVFQRDQIVVLNQQTQVNVSTRRELLLDDAHFSDVLKVAEVDNLPCLVVDLGHESLPSEQHQTVSLRSVMMNSDARLFEALARAWQVTLFLRTHRFCGQCGSRMQRIDWELATQCSRCSHRCYPRISPCVIVAIRKDKQILLAQGTRHTNGMYSTLAGFVESGETLEQAVHREVFEEVGIRVTNLRYFSSQPWPFPHSLMVGFLADYAGGEITPEPKEIADAKWFDADKLPLIPPTFSIAGHLIQHTLALINEQ